MLSIVHTRTMLTRFCGELLQTYVKYLKVKDDNCFSDNSFLYVASLYCMHNIIVHEYKELPLRGKKVKFLRYTSMKTK